MDSGAEGELHAYWGPRGSVVNGGHWTWFGWEPNASQRRSFDYRSCYLEAVAGGFIAVPWSWGSVLLDPSSFADDEEGPLELRRKRMRAEEALSNPPTRRCSSMPTTGSVNGAAPLSVSLEAVKEPVWATRLGEWTQEILRLQCILWLGVEQVICEALARLACSGRFAEAEGSCTRRVSVRRCDRRHCGPDSCAGRLGSCGAGARWDALALLYND
ncbi:hypothetical protein AXF42_Ash003726 [Apostasia shenzhenica]|uniref:Uncharacterized protein n=1 Tax=Apostasia shenzhenica TaxID=1088818 RepID=A0A2I0AHQ1_9ASPA|nr:hypothetical protein AXF42_Ash003726 [Apostasia shenzhenica]